MKCPIDNADLVMSERQGIEIDYCPQCRGVWLDRGELDKIIERATPTAPQAAQQPTPQQAYDVTRGHQESYRSDDRSRPRKKREGFLGELFDF